MGVAQGAALTVAMRWVDRLIGFVSTLILARLLVPDDFGVIAQASLVIGLLSVLTDLGVNIALIQNPKSDQADYDTAWTIRLAQYVLVSLVVFFIAPYAGDYFGDSRIIPVLQIMVVTLVLAGIENIGVISFQKEMQFGLDFRFVFAKRIFGFIATMLFAFTWQSYWALVAGTITGRLIGVMLSYTMHPMRPRLSIERFSDIFSVSQWTLIRGIGGYLESNADRFIIGGRASSTVVGGYTVANEISAMPTSEILAPLNRVLFPAFVSAKEDLAELKRMFLMAQAVQCLIAIPASVGLALVAEEAVTVLLGDSWIFVAPFIQILAIIHAVHAITTSAGYVIVTMGKMRYIALATWSQLAVFAGTIIVLLPEAGPVEIALMRLVATGLGLFLVFWLLKGLLPNLHTWEIGEGVIRPLLGASMMALAVVWVGGLLSMPIIWILMIKIAMGTATYVATVVLLWTARGRPQGAESYFFQLARNAASRMRK